jgi:RimJ/RimL family protein N-acetyltransferase
VGLATSRRWGPNDWSFNGAVFVEDAVVGVQSVMAKDFAALRSVKTDSWLGLSHQGNGLGKEMRSAILHFAFKQLEAREALSGGFVDNESSLGVSRSLGYVDNGRRTLLRRGVPVEMLDLRLDRATWERFEHPEVEVAGLEECLDFFIDPHYEDRTKA